MPRVIRSRSSAQNGREAIAAFQMPYSHAIDQYSAVSMVVVLKIFWKILSCCDIKICWKSLSATYIYDFESICVNEV